MLESNVAARHRACKGSPVACHAQLIRSGISYALCAAAAAVQKLPSLMGTRALWPLLGVRGFVGAASMTLYYEAINRLPLADVVRCAALCCALASPQSPEPCSGLMHAGLLL